MTDWDRERYETVFFGLHGHMTWQPTPGCSLCLLDSEEEEK